jgi:hypothetical protein
MIVIMNGIGMGIYSLLLAPFHLLGAGSDIVDMLGAQSEGAKLFSGTLAIAAGAGGFVAVGGLAGMVGAAIAVIVSILTALVTLILRKMLIIVLLVLAPLALVAWILPGTQKYWDAWWKLFIRLLLMFPLIMVLIASGKIFASLMKDNPNAATPLIVVIAYFIPLFFIPATFKFAGGIFATTSSRLSGMSSKWGKQGGDLAKKKVGDYASNNYQNNGNRWKNGLARATTGNVGLTKNGRYRQRALIANRGAKYSSEREAEDNSLVESEIYGMDYDQKIQHLQDKIADTSLTSREKGAYAAKLTGLGKGEKLSDSFAAAGTALGEQQRTQLAEVLRKKADVAKEYAIKRPDVTFELGTKKYGGETPDGEWETKLGGYLASMEADKVAQLSPDFFKKPESVAKLGPRKADGTRDDVKADKLLADVQRMPIYGQLKGPARDVIDAAADRDSARRASSGGGSTTPPAAPGGTGSGGGGIPPTSGGSGGSPPPPAAPPTPRPTPQPGGSSGQSGPTFGP